MSGPTRVLALWSPDWPVTAAARAAHVPAHRPAAVFAAGRVLACSAVAREQGVRRGLRRREAQARCPDLAVLAPDPDRDARAFEPVVAAVEELAPGVEVVRPGLVALSARGPSGYFGGELAAAERLVDQVAGRTGAECQVGLADGLFAAVLAARRGVAVSAGDTPAFLAPLGVEELDREPDIDRSELVGLLRRLGLRSLGAFAALEPDAVASRFGADAMACHRLARGLDPRPPIRRHPPEELSVAIELDPPVDRVDAAAFTARTLADRLHRTLSGHELACTRLGIAARTVSGAELHRVWRCAEPLTPAGTVDRVRWQLDAWLSRRRMGDTQSRADGPGAVARLWLVPEETVTAGALQLGLWGGVGEADERAGRALVRAQALLGPDSVFTAVLTGGRDPQERVRLVPWGDERGPEEPLPQPPAEPEPGASPVLRLVGASEPGAKPAKSQPPEASRSTVIELLPMPADEIGSGPAGTGAAGRGGAPGVGALGISTAGVGTAGVGTAGVGTAGVGTAGVGTAGVGTERVGTERVGTPGPELVRAEVAPAGWPPDVLRRTGRISAATALAFSRDPTGEPPRPSNRRRRAPARRSTPGPTQPEPPAPWPGRLPAPSPATVPPEPLPAELRDAAGRPVWLTEPDVLSAPPHELLVDGGPARQVRGWAGPWPVRQRWWTPDGVATSRLQLLDQDGAAYLLTSRDGRWWVIGVYD